MKALAIFSAAVAASLLFTPTSPAIADEGPPDPISLDRESPSVVLFGETPGNIYDMPTNMTMPPAIPSGHDAGGPGPLVHVKDVNYGLISPDDNNDAHSNGEWKNDNSPQSNQYLYFSGDDLSKGMPGTDYENQYWRNQAAGDRFVVNGLTTKTPAATMGGAGPSGIAPTFPGLPTNLLSANQHRYHEIPSIGPGAYNMPVGQPGISDMDDMDALELTPFDLNSQEPDQLHDTPIYFSLDPMSPSLNMGASGPYSPADILVSPPGAMGFGRFAFAQSMGLSTEDDVDALAVWDLQLDLPWVADPVDDYALFSLAPGSPFLANGIWSAADIFVTNFTGINALYLSHQTIGMQFEDNVDAIDVEPDWVGQQELLDWVEPVPPPSADSEPDGDVDGNDFLVWQRGYGMVGPGLDPTVGDFDYNQIVDGGDLAIWQLSFPFPVLPASTSVPEPAGCGLSILAMSLILLTARQKRINAAL